MSISSQTEEDIIQNGLLYDCGHKHKTISDALNCKKENLDSDSLTPDQKIISKLLNSKLSEYVRILNHQSQNRDNLKFELEEIEESIKNTQQTIQAVKQTLKQLNLGEENHVPTAQF